jgi:hypothetical protein
MLATLPEGFRPTKVLLFNTIVSSGADNSARVDVHPNGSIKWVKGNKSGWVSLSGISFSTASGTMLPLATTDWMSYGGSYGTATYRKTGDLVVVEGLLKKAPTTTWSMTHLKKHCLQSYHTSHGTFDEAKAKCLELGSACQGVYDEGCNGTGAWRTCTNSVLSPSTSSCVYTATTTVAAYGHFATLPAGYRPEKNLIFNLDNAGRPSRIDVSTSGTIKWISGSASGSYISLSGIAFSTVSACPSLAGALSCKSCGGLNTGGLFGQISCGCGVGQSYPAHNCNNLPASMNGASHPKGCAGAVYGNGNAAQRYCNGDHTVAGDQVFSWWSHCCKWEDSACVPKANAAPKCAACPAGQYQDDIFHTHPTCTTSLTILDCDDDEELAGGGANADFTCVPCQAGMTRVGSQPACVDPNAAVTHVLPNGTTYEAPAQQVTLPNGNLPPKLGISGEAKVSTTGGIAYEVDITAQGLFNFLPTVSVQGFKSVDSSEPVTSAQLASFAADTESDACTLPNTGTAESKCSFYSQCAEKHVPCGKKGYMMSYGDYYCEKFLALEFETQYAKDWRDQTLVCLQTNLQDILREPTGAPSWVAPSTCDDIATKAFDSHEPCYVAQKNNVCNICEDSFEDLMKIFATVEMKEYTNTKSWKALIGVLGTCASGITPTYLTKCAANLARMTADAAVSSEVVQYMHERIKQVDLDRGLSGFADSVKDSMVTVMLDAKDKSFKGLVEKLWNTRKSVERLGIPSLISDLATSAVDRGVDLIQGTIDGLVEHTGGDCALGQGVFGLTAQLGEYELRYILPAGAKVGNCLKKVSSYFLCGVMENILGLKTVGTALDYAQNNLGIGVGFGIGGGSGSAAGIGLSTLMPATTAIYLSCDVLKALPSLIYELHKVALFVKDQLTSIVSAAAALFTNNIVGSDMDEDAAKTMCANTPALKEPRLLHWGGPDTWSAKLSAKIGFPEVGVTFSATVKSGWIVDFVEQVTDELVDLLSNTLKTTFNMDGIVGDVYDAFVEGAQKVVVASLKGAAAVCGTMTFSAGMKFNMKTLDKNGFFLAFECADLPSVSEIVQGFPRLGCGALGVCPFGPGDKLDPGYADSDAAKMDACTTQAGDKKVGIALKVTKYFPVTKAVPAVGVVVQSYAYGASAQFDGAIEHYFKEDKLDCMPPPSAMSVGKMLFAIWSELGAQNSSPLPHPCCTRSMLTPLALAPLAPLGAPSPPPQSKWARPASR